MDTKFPDPSRITTLTAVLFLILLALAGCAGSTREPIPTTTNENPAQVPDGPVTNAPPSTQAPDTTVLDASTKPAKPLVMVGGVSFTVELAETPQQVARGLSGRDSLAQGAGMLFVHDKEQRYTFWMKDMRFPLDLLWIDADCAVADISAQVPPPEPGQLDRSLPLFSPKTPVLHVLEINAGAASVAGISIGDAVRFAGSLEGRYGC